MNLSPSTKWCASFNQVCCWGRAASGDEVEESVTYSRFRVECKIVPRMKWKVKKYTYKHNRIFQKASINHLLNMAPNTEDIFDTWVLKHFSSIELLPRIEDTSKCWVAPVGPCCPTAARWAVLQGYPQISTHRHHRSNSQWSHWPWHWWLGHR